MKFKDQGPFGHWHELYESIIDNEIDKIIAEDDIIALSAKQTPFTPHSPMDPFPRLRSISVAPSRSTSG